MLAAPVHSGLSVEAEPRHEAVLVDTVDLLTVMGAAGGGGEQKASYRLMAALRHPSLKEFFFFFLFNHKKS